MTDFIKFKVNGKDYQVRNDDVSSDVMLVHYLRKFLNKRGTKYMCLEGGCGACIVNVRTSPDTKLKSVNSCLVSITSCDGWEITTIEGLGNRQDGYHSLQKTITENHATQCGYCTPGWVMSMNGFLESSNNDVTMLEIEKAFGSNLCRCTGYRSLMDCLKKYGKDCPKEDRIMDIENLSICNKRKALTNAPHSEEGDWCMVRSDEVFEEKSKQITLKDGKIWYRPQTLNEVFDIMKTKTSGDDYMLVAGNTAKGVAPIEEYPATMIDISHLQELKMNDYDQNLIIGAGTTLTEFMAIIKSHSTQEYFSYLSEIYEHMVLVAHIPIRNIGTIAGNLMIKHKMISFQSDVFLCLETVGAQLTIVDWHGNKNLYTMQDFLKLDMNGKVIYNVLLPPLSNEYKLVTFKLMPRAQSAHAIVNAGYLYKLDSNNMVQEARIVYGALSANFVRATATESFLVGKDLFSNDTLQAAIRVLDGELVVEDHPPEPSAEYRRYLAKALFFKGLLTIAPSTKRSSRLSTAVSRVHEARGTSSAKQYYETNPSMYPLCQSIQKVEALYQSAGEAMYVDDTPTLPDEVFGALVLSTVALGTIVKIDPSEALKLEGVLAFYSAKDIPGLNSFTPADSAFYSMNEEVFAEDTVKYYNQPIGVIAATTQYIAEKASKLVKVKYSNVTKPVVDLREAIKDSKRNHVFGNKEATDPGSDNYKVISGDFELFAQYPFTMETLAVVAKPTEEGLEVQAATQWPDATHTMLSRALGIAQHRIDVVFRRIGGGYGMKVSRTNLIAVAAGLITKKLNRPCRMLPPLTTLLTALGKRTPSLYEYEVKVNKSGVIQSVNSTLYEDNGYAINETLTAFSADVYFNAYDATKFNTKLIDTITDTASNTWCRCPGTLETIAYCELMLERIAYELALDPFDVRIANLAPKHRERFESTIKQLKNDAEYATRRAAVDAFNTKNRWKKRGLRHALVLWEPATGQRFDVNMSVYHADGSIAITHGGVEMGQGLNTKVAQAAAYFLKVPVSLIQIKNNSTIDSPNSFASGGSTTTESLIIAVKRCCDVLLTRLEPVKATLSNPTWPEIIKAAFSQEIDLQAHGHVSLLDMQKYEIFGMSLSEVEVDCLTGEYEIKRVDIVQDVGTSFNPDIDVGQVEGGFLMALGYWTCEKIKYDKDGKLLTDRSWDYHLPEARDIPQVFNVHLMKNTYSFDNILGSKGVGEPPACAAVSVPLAIREAIVMARQESGIPTTEWFDIHGPYSTEAVCMAMKTNTEDFKFN